MLNCEQHSENSAPTTFFTASFDAIKSILTFVVGLQLLPQLIHLRVPLAFLLFPPLERKGAEIAGLLVLGLLVGQLAYQRVLVVVRDAYLRTNYYHEIGDGLAVVHQQRLQRSIQHAHSKGPQFTPVLEQIAVPQNVIIEIPAWLQPNSLLHVLVGKE